MARYFQYKVEVFCKEIILDGPLGKTKYYAIRIAFQERSSPKFIRLYGSLMHQILKTKLPTLLNPQLPDHLNEAELFKFKTYQIHAHYRNCWKCNRMNAASHTVDILLGRQFLQNLIVNLAMLKTKRF